MLLPHCRRKWCARVSVMHSVVPVEMHAVWRLVRQERPTPFGGSIPLDKKRSSTVGFNIKRQVPQQGAGNLPLDLEAECVLLGVWGKMFQKDFPNR